MKFATWFTAFGIAIRFMFSRSFSRRAGLSKRVCIIFLRSPFLLICNEDPLARSHFALRVSCPGMGALIIIGSPFAKLSHMVEPPDLATIRSQTLITSCMLLINPISTTGKVYFCLAKFSYSLRLFPQITSTCTQLPSGSNSFIHCCVGPNPKLPLLNKILKRPGIEILALKK